MSKKITLVTHYISNILVAIILPGITYLLPKLLNYVENRATRTFELRYVTIFPMCIYFVFGILLVVAHLLMDFGNASRYAILAGIIVYLIITYYFIYRTPNILIFNLICIGFYLSKLILQIIIRGKR